MKKSIILPHEPEIPLLPNLLTAGNLLCGFFAILTIMEGIFAGRAEGTYDFSLTYGYYQKATYFILFACVLDLLDGRIARLIKQEGPFGREFDSLADIVSFGLAPSLLVAKAVLFNLPSAWMGWGIGALFLLCAGLRLARFNCMAAAPKKEGQSSDFIGLPVPMAAGAIVSTMFLIIHLHKTDVDLDILKYVIALAMICVSVLMMSRVIYPSFKHVNFHTKGTIFGIVGMALVIASLVRFPWIMPAILFCLYILYGLIRPWIAKGWRARIEVEDEEDEEEE